MATKFSTPEMIRRIDMRLLDDGQFKDGDVLELAPETVAAMDEVKS